MSLCRTIVRSCASATLSAKEAILNANDLICRDSNSGVFVTFFYGVLENFQLRYINAGHPSQLLFKNNASPPIALSAKWLPLWIQKSILLEEALVDIDPGTIVIFYTDGTTEASNATGELFGEQRLAQTIAAYKEFPAAEIVKTILHAVSDFTEQVPPAGDIVVFVIKRKLG